MKGTYLVSSHRHFVFCQQHCLSLAACRDCGRDLGSGMPPEAGPQRVSGSMTGSTALRRTGENAFRSSGLTAP